jgi:hypothetical protein
VQRHFFFLPPMAPTGVYAGTFDSGRSPTVTVCPVATGGACGAPLATFRRSTAPGTETIRVDVVNQLYVANWRIDATKFPAGRTYRVVVADGPLALGSAEVSVVASQRAVRPGYSPVTAVVGSTLAVKFRLEVGAPFGVSADSKGTQTVSSPMTPEGTTASLALPAGSLTAGTTSISVKPVASAAAPASPVLVPGTVFDFGPDGTQFAAEVPLTITYDEAKLPRNVSEAALRMYFLNGRRWVRLPSTVSAATNSVVGMTSHFTTFGLLAAVHEVFVGTVGSDGSYVWPDTLIQAGQTRQYKAFVYDSAGTELTDRVVTWSVVDTLATVDSTGLMTARHPGLTMVVAESEGRTDTIRTVITPAPVIRLSYGPFFRQLTLDQIAVYRLELVERETGAPAPPAAPLTVSLSAAGAGGVTLPARVTVPAGQHSVDFPVQATTFGGVEITASAPGYRTDTRRFWIGTAYMAVYRTESDDLRVGQRVAVRILLSEGPMGVATTFTLPTNSNVRFTDADGNTITSFTVPATNWSTIDPATQRYHFSAYFYLEGLAAGSATYGISHPNFHGWQTSATVVP